MVEQVRFFIAGKWALKAVVFEGFTQRSRDVVRFLRFPFLRQGNHIDGAAPTKWIGVLFVQFIQAGICFLE